MLIIPPCVCRELAVCWCRQRKWRFNQQTLHVYSARMSVFLLRAKVRYWLPCLFYSKLPRTVLSIHCMYLANFFLMKVPLSTGQRPSCSWTNSTKHWKIIRLHCVPAIFSSRSAAAPCLMCHVRNFLHVKNEVYEQGGYKVTKPGCAAATGRPLCHYCSFVAKMWSEFCIKIQNFSGIMNLNPRSFSGDLFSWFNQPELRWWLSGPKVFALA